MRHKVFGRKLNRDHNHRQSLFKNLLKQLLIHGRIKTTSAKALAVRPLVEKIIARSRANNLAFKRELFRYFQDRKQVDFLTEKVLPFLNKRNGGYTRIIKLKKRIGDDALIVSFELTDWSLVEAARVKEQKEKQAKEKEKKKEKKDAKTKPKK